MSFGKRRHSLITDSEEVSADDNVLIENNVEDLTSFIQTDTQSCRAV